MQRSDDLPYVTHLNHSKKNRYGCLQNCILYRVWDASGQHSDPTHSDGGLCVRGSVRLVRERSRQCRGMPKTGSGPQLTPHTKAAWDVIKNTPVESAVVLQRGPLAS